MKNIPQKIYLQVLGDSEPDSEDDFDKLVAYGDATFSANKIHENDLEYHYNPLKEWVSCDDRMPEKGVRVLVYDEIRKRVCEAFRDEQQYVLDFWTVSGLAVTVKFWKPLPKGPYHASTTTR